MKKVFLFSLVFIVILQASNMKNEKSKMIDLNAVKVKYINFTPKKIDEACLAKKIDRLFKIIEISRRKSPHQMAPEYKFYPRETITITKKETIELSNQLLQKKHVSRKGNHEWRKVINSKYMIIENKKDNIYIMYPIEPSMFIVSGLPFEEIKEGESILVSYLKHWIDVKECIGNDNIQFK